jgi:hypothetical protein
MSNTDYCTENWAAVSSHFHMDLDQSARETKALVRRRNVPDASVLLRLCLMYGFCNFSLRETVARAHLAGIADLCDVSLLERLLCCEEWLKKLLSNLLDQRARALLRPPLPRIRVCLVDASVITIPGSQGVDWRVHLGLDLARQCIDQVQITDAHGGETLSRFGKVGKVTKCPDTEVSQAQDGGRLLVGDRAYGNRRGMGDAVRQGDDILVRITWQNLPLTRPDGEALKPLTACQPMRPGEVMDLDVQTRPTEEVAAIPGRLIAIRKSEPDKEHAIRRARKERKNGRTPTAETLEACGYIFLFTTLSREEFSAEEVAQLYRLRWQIEMAFKRMKQVMKLGSLNARQPSLCRVFLLSKLIGILLSEEYVQEWRAFSPYAPYAPWGGDKLCAA